MRYSREIKTGVFAVVSILLFILGYQYMKNSKLFQVSREFYVVYENVVGLEEGAPVTVNGMRIGKVKNLSLANIAGDGVLVAFILESDLGAFTTQANYTVTALGAPVFDEANIKSSIKKTLTMGSHIYSSLSFKNFITKKKVI